MVRAVTTDERRRTLIKIADRGNIKTCQGTAAKYGVGGVKARQCQNNSVGCADCPFIPNEERKGVLVTWRK